MSCRKQSYKTYEHAHKSMYMILKKTGRMLWSYTCSDCGDYHLTSNSGKIGRKMKGARAVK